MEPAESTFWSDVRTLALLSRLREDGGYVQRRVFRWYSKTFATPLHLVDDLPLDFILQHYFESMWEKLSKTEIEEEIKKILETPEERWKNLLQEDAGAIQETESEEKALEEVKKALQSLEKTSKKPDLVLPQPNKSVPLSVPQPKPLSPAWNPELGGTKTPATPPSIKMDFREVNALEFDRVLDEDSTPETTSTPDNLAPETPRKPRRSSP